MTEMTKRERVLRTACFEEADRVPLYDILQNDAIIEHFAGHKLEIDGGEETVAVAAGAMLDMTRMVGGPQRPQTFIRGDGLRIQQERWTSWIVERPFDDLASFVPWVEDRIHESESQQFDAAYAEAFHGRIRNRWADFAEGDPTGRRDPTVFVMESGVGLTEMYWAAGMKLFTELMLEQSDLMEAWLDARHRAELRRIAAIADPDLIPIALTYDDIAHKTGTLFSPDWLRRFWVPRLRALVDAWHTREALCLFHSDGNLWGILPDLVDAGVDGLNPIEVMASMTVEKVREAYPKLFLAGGIDVSQLLTYGTPQDVRETCRNAIRDTSGRGYFLGSTTELHWDVPLENAVAMFESVRTA